MAISAVSLPFREQNQFLRRKLNLPTEGWTDIYGREHDYAFVVAGANRDAIVSDFRLAVERAIEGGGTLAEFRQDFDRIVAKHGWSYNGGRNWRSRVIYETNLRSSYMAGRYEQLMAVREGRPYWQYIHSDAVEHPRPQHQAWHGMILRWDDPFWQYHFPINAWGCQCSVRSLSEADLRAMGRSGPDTAPQVIFETRTIGQRSATGPREVSVPLGVDPGFEHIPGQARLHSAVPRARSAEADIPSAAPGLPNRPAPSPLPAPRIISAEQLLDGLAPVAQAGQFLSQFGATVQRPAVWRDVLGHAVVIGADMLSDDLSAPELAQGRWLNLLAGTMLSPDEIWTRLEYWPALQQTGVVRRYVAGFVLDGAPLQVLIEISQHGVLSLIALDPDQHAQVEQLRQGVRLYRRGE